MKAILSVLFILTCAIWGFSQEEQKKWSLKECIEFALENNITIKQDKLTTQLRKADITHRKANFYPSVSGSAGASYSFGSPLKANSFTNNFGISSSVDVYNGNRNKNYVKLAENRFEISKLNLEISENDIIVQVANTYLNVLYNRESVKIAEDQVEVGKKLVERMQGLVNAGSKAKNDLFSVEANLVTNEEELIKAENKLDLALLDLSQLLQITHKGFDVEDVAINIETVKLIYDDSDRIYEKASSFRPEIESAKRSVENAETEIAIAKAGILPTVSASYSFGTNFYNVKDAIGQSGYFEQLTDNRGHSVGISVSIPIFDKYATRIDVQKAQIEKNIAEYTLENEQIKLRSVIERAYIDAKTSLKTYEAAQKSVQAQEESFRTAQERYNLGALTSYDFDQVRNQLVNAQSALLNAKYNFVFRVKLLEFYYGIPISL